MGLVGDFFATTVFKMKVDSAEAIRDIKNMSKEQQKAAKDAAAALNEQGKAAETMGGKYAKGAALIAGAYLVAKNGMEALRKESRLVAGSAGVDMGKLEDAAGGLRTQWELMSLAQAGSQGAWKLSSGQIAIVIEGMRALEKKGYDNVKVTEKFTEVMKKGKLEGLDEFGLSLKSTGDQSKDLGVLMRALGGEVDSVGGNFDKAGDAAERSAKRIETVMERVQVATGKAIGTVLDLAEALGTGLAKQIFGENNAALSTIDPENYADELRHQRDMRQPATQVRDAQGWYGPAVTLSSATNDNDRAASRALVGLRSRLRKLKGDQPGGAAENESLEAFEKTLPREWRDAAPDVAEWFDARINVNDAAIAAKAVDLWGDLRGNFNQQMVIQNRIAARKAAPGRAKAAQKNLDDLMGRALDRDKPILTSWDDDIAAMEAEKRAEADRAYQLSAEKLASNAVGDAGLLAKIAAWQEKYQSDEQKSLLAKVFGPIDEFDLYTEALTTLGSTTQSVMGSIYDAVASGSEVTSKMLRKVVGDEIAAAGKRLLAYGISAVLTGGIKMAASGGLTGGGEVAAGAAAIAGSFVVAKLANAVGGGSAGGGGGAGGYGGAGGGGRDQSQDHRAGGGGAGNATIVVQGDGWALDSPRQRAANLAALQTVADNYTAARPGNIRRG